MPPRVRLAAAALLAVSVAGCAAAPSPCERGAAGLFGVCQSRRLTCESRSAADLLAYHGLPGTEREVFARLPRSDNPDLGFVGDPDGPPGRLPPEGYGVHAGPVARVLVGMGLSAREERDRDVAWLAAEVGGGRPVIAWVTGSCEPSERTPGRDAAGRPYVAVRGEHTVLVLHVTREEVVVLDPATGTRRAFERDAFEAAFRLLGGRAVAADGPAAPTAPR